MKQETTIILLVLYRFKKTEQLKHSMGLLGIIRIFLRGVDQFFVVVVVFLPSTEGKHEGNQPKGT